MTADRKKTPDTKDLREVLRSGGNGRARRADAVQRTPGNPGALPPGRDAEVRELVDAVRALPDVRRDKVAAIRKAIESGTYVVDSLRVAGKMIDEIRASRRVDTDWRS